MKTNHHFDKDTILGSAFVLISILLIYALLWFDAEILNG